MSWLQRHDRECGNLYGVLPLIHGMPVALTEHIDRNPEKQLLRGSIGFVHSWVVHVEDKSTFQHGARVLEKLPITVFVRFPTATWILPGLTEAGVYPICPRKSSWFLDKGKKFPKLKIQRQQLPLAPAFAITAHAAQGLALGAAIVDLQIGRGSSPISSYVALTRVRCRKYVLSWRAVERAGVTKKRGRPRVQSCS